jgi:hypothetical protein
MLALVFDVDRDQLNEFREINDFGGNSFFSISGQKGFEPRGLLMEFFGDQMLNVRKLLINEAVALDPHKLTELCVMHGEAGAEAIVGRTIEALSIGLAKVERAYVEQDLKSLADHASTLLPLAEEIGMTTFSNVTDDVITCARAAEIMPLAATLSRLIRIADKSLTAVWDMENITV